MRLADMEFVCWARVCRRRTTTDSSVESYFPPLIQNQVHEPCCKTQAVDDPENEYDDPQVFDDPEDEYVQPQSVDIPENEYVQPQAFDDPEDEYVEIQAFDDPEDEYQNVNVATVDKTSCV